MSGPAAASARIVAAAARAVALRTPLARIQLVAGRLLEATVPARLRPLGERLDEAVAELDRGIAETLAVLIPPRAHAESAEAVATLEAVRARVAPSLAARDVEWLPTEPVPGPLLAPRSWLHEAAVALVRDAAAARGPGTRLRLDPIGDPEGARFGLHLRIEPEGAPPELATAEPLALRLGGWIDRDDQGGATLWLPTGCADPAEHEGVPCGAS